MTCVRRAWLTLGGESMPLEDTDGGRWVCTTLDLGWPEVREVTNNRPDQDGIDDRTEYFGSRAISADIQTRSAWAQVDDVATQFAPYMLPSVRPQLHYVLDTSPAVERVLTVRASGYSWPIVGGTLREIHLAWVAADPIPRDATVKTATAWAGSSTSPGRNYNLTFNRLYPPGGGSPTTATLINDGDVPVSPLLRIYGPITAPHVKVWASVSGATVAVYDLYFEQAFVIGSGQYVEVDCARRTVTRQGDPTQPVLSSLVWLNSRWPVVHPLPDVNSMTISGQSTAGTTQVQAFWQDGYLT